MKHLLTASILLAAASNALATEAGAQERASARTSMDMTIEVNETRRRGVVASNIRLDDAEAEAFWPLYDAYRDEVKSVELSMLQNIQRFAERFNDLDDATATDLLTNAMKREGEVAKLREAHLKKVQSVLSPIESLRYFQLDAYLNTAQRQSVMSQIPLAGTDIEALIEQRRRMQQSSEQKPL